MSFKVYGKPLKLSFHPKGDYIAIFTNNDVYIWDIDTYSLESNTRNDLFKIYKGYLKYSSCNFTPDWKKVYFSSAGSIIAVNQPYFVSQKAFEEQIRKVNVSKSETGSFFEHKNEIENLFNKK
ncbi:hypothetical protein UABHE_004103 [Candidatus Uabimicrobium helgolandensis]